MPYKRNILKIGTAKETTNLMRILLENGVYQLQLTEKAKLPFKVTQSTKAQPVIVMKRIFVLLYQILNLHHFELAWKIKMVAITNRRTALFILVKALATLPKNNTGRRDRSTSLSASLRFFIVKLKWTFVKYIYSHILPNCATHQLCLCISIIFVLLIYNLIINAKPQILLRSQHQVINARRNSFNDVISDRVLTTTGDMCR